MQNSASGSSGPVRRSRRRHSTFGVPLAAPSSKATRPNFIVRSATNAPPVLSTDYVVKNRLGEVSESTPLVLDRHFPPTAPLNGTNGNDSEMAATQILSEEPQEVLDIREQDVFEQVPNLFRLLDLVDEQGSGGIVEKTIIDQASLHRLLDAVQPGSYGSVSNINFKALDTLSIRATGLYGIRSEIVNYLSGAGCLSDNAVTLLSREATSTIASPPVLRSGLYLILRPEADSEGSNLKQAYIIYWPEDSTWDDQAASSSVRRNRITFMRYLTKLTEQLVALVSPDQAYNFVWDTTARNKDLPEGQAESDDDSRLFSFEVSKSLGQEEAATSSPGFIVHAEPTHLPKNVVGTETKLVAGEQKAALMVSVRESSWTDRTPFNENIEEVSLRDIIAGNPNRPQLQLGDLLVDDLLLLADNGLREKYPEPFRNYERCMRDLDTARSTQEIQGRETVNHNIQQDIPMIREGLRDYIRNIYIQLYPSLNTATNDITNDSEASALLHARYPALSGSEFDIQKTNKLNQIMDRRFQSLKSKWILIRDSLTAEPLLSEETQAEFVSNVLDGADGDPPRLPPQRSLLPKGTKRSFVNRFVFGPANSVVGFLIGESAGSDTTPKSMREHGPLTDPQFVSGLRPLQASFPVLEDVTRQIYDCLLAELSSFEERTAAAEVDKIVFMERERLTDLASRTCQDDFQRGKSRAFEELMTELREAMPNTALFLQLVRDKCLAVISEPGKSHIYIEDNLTLDQSINRKSGKVALIHHSLGGSRCLFAFDQTTRLLAIVHGEEEPKLSVYIFDEQFSRLRSRGSSISLKGWYDAEVRIEKACFVSGKEEVCLIEDTGRARVFSLITQQFRSATLQINAPIIDAFSALDGSCLFVTVADQEAQQPHERLLAFHWASFGSNHGGIHVTDLSPSDAARIVTRLEGRGRNHVLSFSFDTQSVNSVAVEVKQKATEFSIRSNDKRAQTTTVEAFNNSLIDCHLEVWTRFPVVPAVSRCTLVPVSRQPRKIVFQSLVPLPELGDYFARMISTFERTTRKPMDGSLSAISVVSSVDGEASLNDGVSEFLFGSFIVELLCLIPLHLALTRDNRFIPLKDGVWDPEYERSLLGADVPAIIDALSLGWYESLFQSYMATKASIPVRVVSSMGEQSVGKSYCLNHFADTTFAGSAMRTTEGVWLSCTPTESYLLVSLDFEGVHSIERSAQEDALLVLFNTAISNLVLFRNNFALSRDIAGLFTSFQSSAMVLDPNTNMGLFNASTSTLAIIIKDVTDSDSRDIVNEFHLKFLQIVEREKDQNFISRLHRGRIDIIPWPVINTPIFYTLFRRLRQNLERQQFTHGTGGAFLHSLKTLMAKIKAQDWGALDQNLATHRAQQLLERLPRALSDGYSEEGPLKNMDTDEELSPIAERLSFFVPKLTGGAESEVDEYIDRSLQGLVKAFGPAVGVRQHIQDRAYVETMQDLIHKSLDRRIDQIRNWITVNVSRFPQSNQDIRDLFGKFNNAALTMRAAARLCSSTCSNCQLQCLQPHRHVDETHHCGTNHRCAFSCAIAEEHPRREPCGLPHYYTRENICARRVPIFAESLAIFEMLGSAVRTIALKPATGFGTSRMLNTRVITLKVAHSSVRYADDYAAIPIISTG
ncbi:hypothetical protein FRC09_018672 [Ceratobasidium sp. 395]|nr:hypothetical protein FRC09_018672 [Ceratobasidium sp. 395]